MEENDDGYFDREDFAVHKDRIEFAIEAAARDLSYDTVARIALQFLARYQEAFETIYKRIDVSPDDLIAPRIEAILKNRLDLRGDELDRTRDRLAQLFELFYCELDVWRTFQNEATTAQPEQRAEGRTVIRSLSPPGHEPT